VLTIADIKLDRGISSWQATTSDETILCANGVYWLGINVYQGKLVWHSQSVENCSIQRRQDQKIRQSINMQQGQYYLTGGSPAPVNHEEPLSDTSLRLEFNGNVLTPNEITEKEVTYDFADSANGLSGLQQITLASSQTGFATVYAPVVFFDVD